MEDILGTIRKTARIGVEDVLDAMREATPEQLLEMNRLLFGDTTPFTTKSLPLMTQEGVEAMRQEMRKACLCVSPEDAEYFRAGRR